MEADLISRERIDYRKYKLIIFPSFGICDDLPLRYWERIKEFVTGGGTIFFSYKNGYVPADLEEVFGIGIHEYEEITESDLQLHVTGNYHSLNL